MEKKIEKIIFHMCRFYVEKKKERIMFDCKELTIERRKMLNINSDVKQDQNIFFK